LRFPWKLLKSCGNDDQLLSGGLPNEGLKKNSTIVIVPSTVVETMQLGSIAGVTALTMGLGQECANKEKESELKKQE
jgi:hypothetical protein